MDRDPAPAALERALVRAHQVLGLLLELDVGVADQPEEAGADAVEAGKEALEEEIDQLLEHDEADRLARSGRQAHEALDLRRHRHQRPHVVLVCLAHQPERQHQAHVRDERKGMGRVDRERGQHREDPLHEPGLEPGAVGGGELHRLEHDQPGRLELLAQAAPDAVLLEHQRARPHPDLGQLLGRRAPVGRDRHHARLGLSDQPGDADREELVEVGGADRDEAQPLEQRVAPVLGLLDDAAVEVEPGKLAVDEPLRARGVDRRLGRRLGRRSPGVANEIGAGPARPEAASGASRSAKGALSRRGALLMVPLT